MHEPGKQISNFREFTTVPKYLLQGNIFSATKNSKKNLSENRVKTYSGKEVSVVNYGFTQFDLAVSLAYKKIINSHINFDNITFTISDFAAAMNRKDGGRTRTYIIDAFKRSNGFHLSFTMDNGLFFDGYRLKTFTENKSNEFNIAFNMDYLSMAYNENEICNIDINLFLSLQLGLQSWLYGFICSLPEKSNIDLDDLHKYSGSNYKSSSDFKKAVKEALISLYHKGILGWSHGVTRDGNVFWNYKNPFLQMKCT